MCQIYEYEAMGHLENLHFLVIYVVPSRPLPSNAYPLNILVNGSIYALLYIGVDANKEQTLLAPKALQDPQADQVTNDEFRVAFTILSQVVASPKTSTLASRVRFY